MGERIRIFFADGIGRITAFLPNLVSAILILAVGYGLSRLLAVVADRVLSRAGFDRFIARRVHHRAAEHSPSHTVGAVVFWLGMLTTLSLTANTLGLVT